MMQMMNVLEYIAYTNLAYAIVFQIMLEEANTVTTVFVGKKNHIIPGPI
jgi:hypothetical protein